MQHRSLNKAIARTVGLLGLTACSMSAWAEEQSEPAGFVEDIVVVGEKAQRSLRDTASSVSVVSEESLNELVYHSIADAISEIPNVVVLSGAVPDIRGISGNGSAGGFNSISGGAKARVSTLIDGVSEPFVADRTGDSGIWDVEQIEVYRGPQSTISGRNSIGGMVYVKTKDPSFDWEGAVRVGYRSEDQYLDYAGVISGPIIEDKLAFRLSVQQLDAQTISDDDGFDTNPPHYDLNEIDTTHVKGKLLWQPTEQFSALLTYSDYVEGGDTGRIYYAADNPEAYERIFFRDIETDSQTTSLKLDYTLNENLAFDLLIATKDYVWGFDSYEADPADQQFLVFDQTSTTLDGKVSFGLASEQWSGFVGLAYYERDEDYISTGSFLYNGDDSSESSALYTEVTYAYSDALDITLGLRLQREEQNRTFNGFGASAVLDEDKTITLPKLVVQYALTDQTTIAFSARKGYNAAGGAFAFASGLYYNYDEETVVSYEGSIRSTLSDGALNLSANVFYNDYDGYQALSPARQIVNMDKAVTYGLELEARASLSSSLDLNVGLGLLEAEIKDGGDAYSSADGNDLNSAPQITANVGANYYFSDAFKIGVSAHYVDEYFGDINNTDERVAGDYLMARLSANYSKNNWTVSAYVNNAFDADDYIVREPPGRTAPNGYVAVLDPRYFGVSVLYNF